MNIQVSTNFKKKTGKAIFAIILFIITYISLIFLAIVLTILCVIGGFFLITVKLSAITIGLGIGLASLGFFILLFLFKFIFKKHKIDRSHLIEITEKEEPKLFSFIKEIVKEVNTDFPKKIYLSSEVNASVFYDSNFWSMIFPIRKNLQIGLGLVNSISQQEFKAILAHEFGHFSQRSMKVGSYVYNVNKIIYNMLYENESFEKISQNWANISGYFTIFVSIALIFIQGIKWILSKIYNFVNISYLALSREMEFHADEIAANVAGFKPLKESLLRMDLADQSFNAVLGFYDSKIHENIISKNIYKEQGFVMQFLADKYHLSSKNNLPIVSEIDLNMYQKSKLSFIDQWDSHPTIEERIKALEKTNIHKNGEEKPAIFLFENQEKIQEKITDKLFSNVVYEDDTTSLDFENFKKEYTQTVIKNSLPEEYNGYYDLKIPVSFDDLKNMADYNSNDNMETLFSKQNVEMVFNYEALKNDLVYLINIENKIIDIKTFDYDGKKYKATETQDLISKINIEKDILKEKIKELDQKIEAFFYSKALKNNKVNLLKEKYKILLKEASDFERKETLYNNLENATIFFSQDTPFDQITKNFNALKPLEEELKIEIEKILNNEIIKNDISQPTKENLEKYLSQDWEYFRNNAYNNNNLQIFITAINDYNDLISKQYFLTKLDFLNFQISLLEA